MLLFTRVCGDAVLELGPREEREQKFRKYFLLHGLTQQKKLEAERGSKFLADQLS